MFGYSLSSLWTLVNILPLIYYSAMMTLYYPKIVLSLFSFLGAANFENPASSKIIELLVDTSDAKNKTSWDYRFENQNIESTDLLINCSDTLASLIFFLFTNIFIFLIAK